MWKLYAAIIFGIIIYLLYHRGAGISNKQSLYWFFAYLTSLLLLCYLGPFGGIGLIKFPFDMALILPFSMLMLYLSQHCLVTDEAKRESFELMNQQLDKL